MFQAKNKKESKILEIYKNKSALNWIIFTIAVIIGATSIIYTNNLVEQLKERELRLIELYAKSMEYTFKEPNTADLPFIINEIIVPNNSIPVIITNGAGIPTDSKNVISDMEMGQGEKTKYLQQQIEQMKEKHDPIVISLRNDEGEIYDQLYFYYSNSDLLTKLEFYPYVQLSVIALFGLIVFLAFNYSKTSEQNRVWVGLAKETAHQLGTPISSLMAWIEYLRADEHMKDSEILNELDKDTHRLNTITARFSSIGSVPVLTSENIAETIDYTVSYLKNRISKKVDFTVSAMPVDVRARINRPLFEWVIENLCKNAVDSMGGVGAIDIKVRRGLEENVIVDISDSGKGIPKSKIKEVFSPGYTTKRRGWGLGLTLAKRIIEQYHEGKIYIKSSELDKGTTFRILLNT